MKTRDQAQRSADNYDTAGIAIFQVAGFVQEVKRNEKLKCDYVRFNIQSKVKPEFYDIISVCVPDTVGVACEAGDCVVCKGFIRSWNTTNGIKLEIVAQKVAEIQPEQLKKG